MNNDNYGYQKKQKKNSLKNKIWNYLPYLILLFVVFGFFWMISSQDVATAKIISRQGIHWHSKLLITINGVAVEIPPNIGLSGIHNPIHTHNEDAKDGTIHMEFAGLVTEDNLRLKNFFKVWEKQLTELCVFDNCSETPGKVTMRVNGQASNLFGEYLMKDADIIEVDFK